MEAPFGLVPPKFSLYFEPMGSSTRITFRGTPRPIGPFKTGRYSRTAPESETGSPRLRLIKAALEASRSVDDGGPETAPGSLPGEASLRPPGSGAPAGRTSVSVPFNPRYLAP